MVIRLSYSIWIPLALIKFSLRHRWIDYIANRKKLKAFRVIGCPLFTITTTEPLGLQHVNEWKLRPRAANTAMSFPRAVTVKLGTKLSRHSSRHRKIYSKADTVLLLKPKPTNSLAAWLLSVTLRSQPNGAICTLQPSCLLNPVSV